MATAPASCMNSENGCVMFDCLVHLWEWIDPPVQQAQFQMDNKKNLPATQQPLTQQHIMAHHVHPDQIYTQQQLSNHITSNQPIQNQPNGIIHQQQLIQNQYHANMTARSPLLENRHEIYGTSHNHEYARHYGANDNYNYQQQQSPTQERTEQIIHMDHNVNHDIVQNIPKGYNAEVYQDYLKRNPPKDSNQIYQNHQPPHRPNIVNNQYGSKPYLPYSNRIGPQSNTELLRRQYNEIQHLKMQQQMHYQNQAQMHQQQKFAERQLLLQQIHGVQPPPNLQNSIYSDSSYRDLDRYGSRNDFKEYTGDIHKAVDKYAKNNEYKEMEKQNKIFQETQWQMNQDAGFRDTDRYRSQREEEKTKSHRSPPTDFNNQLQRNSGGTGTISPMKSSESSTPSVKSPSSESRRSSSGQALRSPTAQRIPSAPVTISGMLYKQGSDGLKVWRKRWFVLSEYCLFYYKSQDEEKLLGSVLLPSYKVSACTSEDRVLRKFAFKLEHANMRTYVLAAMEQEAMMKWVKALTMAALMQNYSDQQRKQNERTNAKTEDDDENPGPTYANAPPKPRRSNDGYNSPSSDIYDPNYDLLIKPESQYNHSTSHNQYQDQANYGNKGNQETYVRSPQSPPVQHSLYQTKRPNDKHNIPTTSNAERSQDPSMYKYTPQSPPFDARRAQQQPDENYIQQSQNNPFLQNYSGQEPRMKGTELQSNPITSDQKSNKLFNENYPETRTNAKTYDTNAYARDVYGELNTIKSVHSNSGLNERIMERRTPDAYGRSTAMSNYKNKVGDYEDVYSTYSNENPAKSPNLSLQRDNISLSSQKQAQKQNQPQEKVFSGPSVLRRKKMQASGIQPPMPRPHSADFLEYESKNESINKTMAARNVSDLPRHPQRPKSSLDINSYYDTSSDTYYSEESYAEKMRQSAQYLQQQAVGPRNIQIPLAKYASGLVEKQLHSPYAHSANNNYETEFGIKNNRDNISYTSKYSDLEGLNSNWMLKEKDLENKKDYLNRSGSIMSDGSNASYIKEASKLDPNVDGFIRSASARLPSTERDGETKIQQREESMKRLLEWKQRMLQSPLTRKSTPATISLARSLNQSRQSLRSDQFKPKTYTNNSYNSYSSDDEEETPGTDLQNSTDMQAGRSYVEGVGNPSKSQPISHHVPCTTSTKPTGETDCNKVTSAENTYENIMCEEATKEIFDKNENEDNIYEDHIPPFSEISVKQEEISAENCNGYETHESESESEAQVEYTDNDLDEVLLESDDDEEQLNICNPDENKLKTDDKEYQSIKSETPPTISFTEDHYLPMSPRKALPIEPAHKMILENLSVFDHSMPIMYEDNPYVEMNLGGEQDDMETYEIVCVNNGKMVEPVYMELNNVVTKARDAEDIDSKDCYISDTASNFADTKDPTLKRVSKIEKSKEKAESSDADDECSKDLSLDAPFSRLSISDTFRPASYYLSGATTILVRQDSSDSDILPPPPIPNSSPPCEELSDEALSRYILDKLDKSDISQDNSILKMLTNEKQNMNKMKRKTTSLMIYGSRTSIHDTLTRGEKVRHNRASLTNDRNKIFEDKDTVNLLNRSLFDLKHNSSECLDSDSFRSCNVERGSSRLSLDSDVSSKFEATPSNLSSEITSLIDGESMLDLNTSRDCLDTNVFRKSLPLSENYLFGKEVTNGIEPLSVLPDETGLFGHKDLNESIISFNETEKTISSLSNNPNLNSQCSHSRSSSTPVNSKTNIIPNNNTNNLLEPKRLAAQYKSIVDHASGYIGSQSSCSSVGVSNSPISFYTKNKGETLLRKNLNRNTVTDKIKEFESEKINIKEKYNNSSSTTGFHSRESSTEHSAPYYYSDLSSQEHINVLPTSHYLKNTNVHRKLNNQRRRGLLHKKNEISHIHNPIHGNNNAFIPDNSFELAAARSVSVEFLSATEKDTEIDIKNIYESTGNKPSKIPESINLIASLGCKRNASTTNIHPEQRQVLDHADIQHRNFLKARVSTGSMSSHCSENSSNTVYYDAETEASTYENVCVGEKHWDEDHLWRDNLRRVSHRHARSMDDLDAMPDSFNFNNTPDLNSIKRVKKSTPNNKVSRTYVNCDVQAQVFRNVDNPSLHDIPDENDVYVSLANDANIGINKEQVDEGVYEQLSIDAEDNLTNSNDYTVNSDRHLQRNRKQFEIDRETLRQWDLMSSGLMKDGTKRVRGAVVGLNVNEAACGSDNRVENEINEASMTMSGTNIESNTNNNQINQQTLSNKAFLGSNTSIGRNNRDGNIPVRAVSPRVRWVEDKSNEQYGSQQLTASQQNLSISGTEDSWATLRSPSRISQQPVSAVSPRVRRNTETDEMQKVQSRELVDIPTAGELLGRSHEELVLLLIQLRRRHAATHRSIEQCYIQINSIEECLSSLKALEREESLRRLEQLKMQLMELEQQYAKSKPLVQLVDNMVKLGSLYNKPGSTIERLERNQRLRQKVLAEHALEQQRWLESAAAGKPLETEAARARVAELWALEQELADEASILQGLKTDKDTIETLLSGVRNKLNTVNMDDVPLPGGGLEAELARVHAMLAHNSKKLEQTVAENARLERELQQLRRALRARRASAPQPHPSHPAHPAHPTAMLEDEVTRVQQLVTALQRQRQELSRAVRHLTEQSQVLQTTHDAMPGKRRPTSYWQETNLDTGHTIDHGQDYEYDSHLLAPGHYGHSNVEPLYVDTRGPGDITSPMNSEDMQVSAFGNLSNVEKQEIKTVRIVKRESERRQRDRERSLQPMSDWSSSITANLDQFLEEELVQPINNYRASSVPRTDYTKFEEYYAKQNKEAPYLRFDKNLELSPRYPSSPSLSNYDYSRDTSSYKSYDRSGYDRLSLSNQYLNSPTESSRTLTNDPISKTSSVMSLTRSNIELSPIFKSEAAKQIITEMSDTQKNSSLHRRQVPKEKRRHYTAPHHLSAKTLNELPKEIYKQDAMGRSVDDADMERALRGAAPDVVRSALPSTKIPDSIDQLLAAPQKIIIPERYIPEKPPELSPEEQQKRQEKVESIKKMLTSSSADPSKSPDGEQKRQREHLLQMNQILAKQVTEMSKIIAVKALEDLPPLNNAEDSDRSPDVELPIYQQRDNFFT